MGLLREVKQSILGKRMLYFIIYIQLVIVFFATIYAGHRIAYSADYLSRIRNATEPTWVKPRITDFIKDKELQDKPELVEELYNFFLSSNDVRKAGSLSVNEELVTNPDFQNTLLNSPSKLISTVFVDKFFLEHLGKKIRSGRNLNEEDYNSELKRMPVLVSYNLRYKHKVGSTIGEKYEVVGVLKRNAALPAPFDDFMAFGTIESNFIVTPKMPFDYDSFPEDFPEDMMQEIKRSNNFNDFFACIYIELKDEESLKSFTETLTQKGNDIGIPIKLESLTETTKFRIKSDLPRSLPSIFVAIITIFLSVIGQIAVNLSLLLRKKREFGIKLACGASLRNICSVIIVEMLVLISMAISTSYVIEVFRMKSINSQYTFVETAKRISPTTNIITLAIAAIIFLVVCIVPILRIRKMEPTELIREV